MGTYTIKQLQKADYEDALIFVCQEFTANSVLHKDSGVSLTDYTNYLRKPFLDMAAEQLSFLAIDESNGRIVGCLLAGDYAIPHSSDALVPVQIKPINALIAELERCYDSKRTKLTGTTLFVDIAVVTKDARGQGLYFQLRQSTHQAAIEKGFRTVIGELSSKPPQKMCTEKLGHKVICEIAYHAFEYEGTLPFKDVPDPPSIQLVEGKLE